jgi:radical SAM protein with 4Fe4S-binding SPASM domain
VGARFDSLVLFWLGEPLLHPHFASMYQEILRVNEKAGTFGRVEVHTNGTRLASHLALPVNEARTEQVWHFSLDAARSATWRRLKGSLGGFRDVEKAIEALASRKASRGAPWPRMVLQFILSSRNVDEAAHFRYRWERAFRTRGLPLSCAAGAVPAGPEDLVFFRQLDCPTPEAQARENRVFDLAVAALGLETRRGARASSRPPEATPCSGHWKSPVIGWDGEVTVCTRDARFDLKVGNVRDTPFSELWWGPVLAERRRRLAEGDLSLTEACGGCFIPGSENHAPLARAELLRQRAWDDAVLASTARP